MKTVPPEVKNAIFNMEDAIASLDVLSSTLVMLTHRPINTSIVDGDDNKSLVWLVTELKRNVVSLDGQWQALFQMTLRTSSREGGAA